VTTQHIEPENSDVNLTVVEQQPASTTPVTSEESEVAAPAQDQVAQAPEEQTLEEQAAEEIIRPFTDFIEEFRQTEVRFGSSLEESQLEPFSSLVSREEQDGNVGAAPAWEHIPFSETTLLEGTLFPVEGVGIQLDSSSSFALPLEHAAGEVGKASEAVALPEEAQLSPQEQPQAASGEITPEQRLVSPLLRPASRVRLPRHGGGRHREERTVEAATEQKPGVETETPSPTPLSMVEMSQAESAPVAEPPSVEPAPGEEQPRPARRYRFDRRVPTASAMPATPAAVTPAQVHTEEAKDNRVPSQPLPRTENTQVSEREVQATQQPKQSTGVPAEQVVSVAQEPVTTRDAEVKTAKEAHSTTQDRRRRHGQERQREKARSEPAAPAPAEPVEEVAAPVAETGAPQDQGIALEDLPPLEYSELQAASSRRRRRRRSGSANSTVNAPATGTTPSLAPLSPVSPVAAPRTIAVPGNATPSASQHGVQSGYTVSQMNQGNDLTGPFMGPEPSPARGSTVSRAVRPIRNEVQHAPAYPVRQHEAASAASINHLANVVAQAIQTQSDRMIAELRRSNQIPTSVSVSLPPFPSTERVGVFVDVANLLYSARTLRMTIDFGKLLDFLRGNRRLVRAHAYCPTSPQPGDDQMFLQAVKGLGYRITTKNYKTFSSGAKKADLDLDLCMDVVRLVDGGAVDCIVLVSGDSDFMPMLDYCSDHGVRVEVAAFDESMSATLRQSCDLFINLSMLDEIRA
jgi:uncharacterized LabA/DUF88 family protein